MAPGINSIYHSKYYVIIWLAKYTMCINRVNIKRWGREGFRQTVTHRQGKEGVKKKTTNFSNFLKPSSCIFDIVCESQV